jgi:hypothetical protein
MTGGKHCQLSGGKRSYPTRVDALLSADAKGYATPHAYRCEHCAMWHITRRKQ